MLAMTIQICTASAQETVFSIRENDGSSEQIGIFSLNGIRQNNHHLLYATAQYPNALIQYTRLLVGSHGWPRSYLLQAGIQGQTIRIRVQISAESLTEEVSQGKTTKRYRFRLTKPVDLIDNNDLTGFQALLDRVGGKAVRGEKFRVFVPQAISFGELQVERAEQAKIVIGRARETARILRLRLQLRNQQEPIQIAFDPVTHDLLQFSQLKTSVQITARPHTHIARTLPSHRHCVTETAISTPLDRKQSQFKLIKPAVGRSPRPAMLLIRSTPEMDPANHWPWKTPMSRIDDELAKGLACNGIATLLFSPTPNQFTVSPRTDLQQTARKIARGLTILADQPGVDPRRIFLAGNSIGGLLALYTISGINPQPSGLILIDTPGKPLQDTLTQSLVESARREGAPGHRLAALRAGLKEYFLKTKKNKGGRQQAKINSIQPYRVMTNILLGALTLNPAKLATQVHTPMLIVQGGKDLSVMPENARLLAEADPDAQRVNEPNMTHSLVTSRLPPLSAILTQPDQPVDPNLIRAISRWIEESSIKMPKTASNHVSY